MKEFFIAYECDGSITTRLNGAKERAEDGLLPSVIRAETMKEAVCAWLAKEGGDAFADGQSEIELDVLSEGVVSVVGVERDWDPVYYISEPKAQVTQPVRRSTCPGESHSNGFIDACALCLKEG